MQSNKIVVGIQKNHPLAQIPSYNHEGDSGFDLCCVEPITIPPGETIVADTGLIFELPIGTELQVRPRSGLSLKTGLRVANSPGTIDSGYRGSVGIILHNTEDTELSFPVGSKLAQGVICPVITAVLLETNNVTSTSRGADGYGSTGV